MVRSIWTKGVRFHATLQKRNERKDRLTYILPRIIQNGFGVNDFRIPQIGATSIKISYGTPPKLNKSPEFRRHHRLVNRIGFLEFFVCAITNDTAILENKDTIRDSNRAETVCNDKGCATFD